mgnify:CR=1 FL=1
MSESIESSNLRIFFICKFCSAAHIFPNSHDWVHESKLRDILSAPSYQCPGNHERMLAPHYEIQEGLKVIDHFDIIALQYMNEQKITSDEIISLTDGAEKPSDDVDDDILEISANVVVELDNEKIPFTQPMKFTHGDPDIAKMQIQLIPTMQNLSSSDAFAMSHFVENYVELYKKAKLSDPDLSEEVAQIIRGFAQNRENLGSGIVPSLVTEFTKKYFEPHFGEYIRNNFQDFSEKSIYSNLPNDIDEEDWKYEINTINWSWKEIVWLVRWSNQQLHTPGVL